MKQARDKEPAPKAPCEICGCDMQPFEDWEAICPDCMAKLLAGLVELPEWKGKTK